MELLIQLHMCIFQVIAPARSSMELLSTKAEIKLRKAGPGSWSSLELVKKQPATDSSTTTKGGDASKEVTGDANDAQAKAGTTK